MKSLNFVEDFYIFYLSLKNKKIQRRIVFKRKS